MMLEAQKAQVEQTAAAHEKENHGLKQELEKHKAKSEEAHSARQEAERAAQLAEHKLELFKQIHEAQKQIDDHASSKAQEGGHAPHLIGFGIERLQKKIDRIRSAQASIAKTASALKRLTRLLGCS